jgi:hypothetical protein
MGIGRGIEIRFQAGATACSFLHNVQTPLWTPTHPPIQWTPGALSPEVKWPGRESDHSPPSGTEVNNEWSYTFTSSYVFMAWCLINYAQGQLYRFTSSPLGLKSVGANVYVLNMPRVSSTMICNRKIVWNEYIVGKLCMSVAYSEECYALFRHFVCSSTRICMCQVCSVPRELI